jgi:N-carbamoylputrescine amidase
MRTSNEIIKFIRVAAVQSQSRLGNIEANLQHFTPLVEQAAGLGTQLIAFPELAASGYSMSKMVWDAAERRDGATVSWLQQISLRLGVFIGIGFVEVEGEDFFNTFALSAPDGRIAGYVRKTMAETYCFRCTEGPHVIETEIGRIGVGICADNLFVANLDRMQDNAADILLMPHAAPLPYKAGGLVSEKDILEAHQTMSLMATDRAQRIGVPVVFVNQVGRRGAEKWVGTLGKLMSPETFRLGGLSTIVSSDGTILAQLNDQDEAVIVADVTLDPAKKISSRATRHGSYGGGFVTPHPFLFEAMCYLDAFTYGLSYQLSSERRRKARVAASPTES